MRSEALHFTFDGISSKMMGVSRVHLDVGLYEDRFAPIRSITKERIGGNEKSYTHDIELEDLAFPMVLYLDEPLDEWQQREREIKRWLYQDYYKPLMFEGYEDQVVYCMATSAQFYHNGIGQGYIEVEWETNSPYIYSPVYTIQREISGADILPVENYGDKKLEPKVFITKTNGNGAVRIDLIKDYSWTHGYTISNLADGETVLVDCDRKEIESDLTYRYDDFEGEYLSLPIGTNSVKVIGDCKIELEFQYRYL